MKKDEQKNLEDDITQKQLEEEFRQLNYRFHIQLGMSEEEATQKAQEEVQTVFSDKGRISREEIEHISGMLESLLSAFVIVLVMMMVLFRSVVFGLLAMIPLTLTITMIYGLIGFIGKEYDMPIAVLSALTLGLSVDFAIHFLERLRSIYNETGSWKKTIDEMFEEPALAITRNAIVISVGFLPLLVAPLVPYNTVGFFLAAIMAISAIATLVILTSIIHIARRSVLK